MRLFFLHVQSQPTQIEWGKGKSISIPPRPDSQIQVCECFLEILKSTYLCVSGRGEGGGRGCRLQQRLLKSSCDESASVDCSLTYADGSGEFWCVRQWVEELLKSEDHQAMIKRGQQIFHPPCVCCSHTVKWCKCLTDSSLLERTTLNQRPSRMDRILCEQRSTASVILI